jgi:serine/threonine protein kinase
MGSMCNPITGTGWVFMEPMAISMNALCLKLGADEYFSEDVLANCALSVFEGLRYMEVHEMAHTPVKPSTIFRSVDGEFKISILPLFHLPTPLNFAQSSGDFCYISPDRIKSDRVTGMAWGSVLSGEAVWGFGLTLCEFAMKEYPFVKHVNQGGPLGALQAIVDGGAPPMPDRYSADFRDFVRQCLVNEAAQRPGFATLVE